MREVLLSVGAALLLLNFACSQNDGDQSGSTGIRCTGSGTAPACFAWNGTVTQCFVPFFPPGPPPAPVPSNFSLTVESGEGSAFCTTPGTVGTLSVVSASPNNVSTGKFQSGSAEVSDTLVSCGAGAPITSAFAYYPKAYGSSIFNIDLSNRGNFTLFLDPDDSEAQTNAQFCFQTDNSGTYQLNAEDGSRQNGTWTN